MELISGESPAVKWRCNIDPRETVILCVDDEAANLELLEEILLHRGYIPVKALDGREALEKIQCRPVDLVLMDVNMPGMDGLEACRRIKEDPKLRDIPVVMITGLVSHEDRIRGIEAGVEDYFPKPFHERELLARVEALLKAKRTNDERRRAEVQRTAEFEALHEACGELERQVRSRKAELDKANETLRADRGALKRAEEKIQHSLDKVKGAVGATIRVLMSTVEIRDPYTAAHQVRVAGLAVAIAGELGLGREKVEGLRMAGLIHDIGKLSIPAEILTKPTKLTEIERFLIQEHSAKGYAILKGVESPWPLAEIVYQHHERIDGSGYPRGLKGGEILIEARILAVADALEAMASHRPYRPALGIAEALAEVSRNRGILYDAESVDATLPLFHDKGYQFN